jgi:DNA repair exonuclease SbcCD ATPase subunit
MSKSETARQLADEQTQPQQGAARTEAEHQRSLTQLIDQLTWHVEPLAQSMATLTEQTRQAVAEEQRHQAEARQKIEHQVGQLRDQVATVQGAVSKLERVADRVETPAWRLIVYPAVGTIIALTLWPRLRQIVGSAYNVLWSVL